MSPIPCFVGQRATLPRLPCRLILSRGLARVWHQQAKGWWEDEEVRRFPSSSSWEVSVAAAVSLPWLRLPLNCANFQILQGRTVFSCCLLRPEVEGASTAANHQVTFLPPSLSILYSSITHVINSTSISFSQKCLEGLCLSDYIMAA